MTNVRIQAGKFHLDAVIDDSLTGRRIVAALPLEGIANRWGEEIYFEIPVAVDRAKDARADVAVGELAYWPDGQAFCIFFGPTPVSTGDLLRAYSPVNVFGRIQGDATVLRAVASGEAVRVFLPQGR